MCHVRDSGLVFPSKILHLWGNMHDWHILMTEGITFNGAPMTSCWHRCSTSELLCANCTSSFARVLKCLQLAWMKQRTEVHISSVGGKLEVTYCSCSSPVDRLTGWHVVKTCGSLQTERLSARILFPANSYTQSFLPICAAHLPSLSSPSPKNSFSSLFYLSRNHLISCFNSVPVFVSLSISADLITDTYSYRPSSHFLMVTTWVLWRWTLCIRTGGTVTSWRRTWAHRTFCNICYPFWPLRIWSSPSLLTNCCNYACLPSSLLFDQAGSICHPVTFIKAPWALKIQRLCKLMTTIKCKKKKKEIAFLKWCHNLPPPF